MAIDPKSIVWDEPAAPAAIDPNTIVWDEPAPTAPAEAAPEKPNPWEGLSPLTALSALGPLTAVLGLPISTKQITDANGGIVRGAGSLAATAMAPIDSFKDAKAGRGLSLQSNRERRASMDDAMRELGADPTSPFYKGGKLASEIGLTLGTGGALAKGASMAGASPALSSALATGGLNVAGRTGLAGLGTRALGGAIAGGATAGLINPEDAKMGALVGGAMPLVLLGGAKGTSSAVKGVKSLVEPLHTKGREKIVGRALREFSGDSADDAIRNLQAARELVPGSKPTVGEAAQVPSLAALQRSTVSNSAEAANTLHERFAANNQARIDALEALAGSPAARRAAEEARAQAADAAYGAARGQAAGGVTPSQDLLELAERPAMKKFIASAKRLAADKGQKIDNPLESIDGLHYVKLAVDDALAGSPSNALARNQKAAVMDIKDRLIAEMDKVSPAYGESRRAYQEASKPINQMDIGDELKKVIDPLTGRIRASQFARKLSDDTARQATGFKQATLAGTLTPEQLASLSAIQQDLARAEFAQTAGRGVGSNTAQNLGYSNMLNQLGVPNFLRNFSGGEILGSLGVRAGDVVYGKANQEIAGLLANTMLEPAEAARLMLMRDGVNPALLSAGRKGLLGVTKTAPAVVAD